jgi:uncharacterized protein YecE (DUF72 family)
LVDAQGKRVAASLHVGTMGWSYNFWKGKFYPENLSSEEFLAYYAQRFSTVEVDSTFYRIPRAQTIIDWKEQTPESFQFSLKFPQVITHVKMLKNCADDTKVFLERVSRLEEKLGVLLLQFPSMFRQQHVPLLQEYLKTLPITHRYAVEVRNKTLLNDDFYALLRSHNVALAWADSSTMPLIDEVTAGFIYVRFEGDRKTVNGTLGMVEFERTQSIKAWAERLIPFLDKRKEVFAYFSKYYSGSPTKDVSDLLNCAEE